MARARSSTGTVAVPRLLRGLVARAKTEVPRHTGPRLARDQRTRLGLVNTANIELLAQGGSDPGVMMQWAEGLLLWHYVSIRLGCGEVEMEEQLTLATAILQRFGVTGHVSLTKEELSLAKLGVQVCDALVDETSLALAEDAALWAETQIQGIWARASLGVQPDFSRDAIRPYCEESA